jgi:hypothetical protein
VNRTPSLPGVGDQIPAGKSSLPLFQSLFPLLIKAGIEMSAKTEPYILSGSVYSDFYETPHQSRNRKGALERKRGGGAALVKRADYQD